MSKKLFKTKSAITILLTLLVTGCGSSEDSTTATTDSGSDTTTNTNSDIVVEVNPLNFTSGALDSEVATQTCTLTNNEEAQCYEIQIAGAPASHEIGIFCPRYTTSNADEAGIWFDGDGQVYDLTGEFITNLDTHYNDSNWKLYNESTGKVNVTTTEASCAGAARPDVEEQYQNHCVECAIDYVDGGISQTVLIPITPVKASSPISIGRDNIGISLNGVALAPPAPVDAILGAYTIAAFDDCAGHINLVEGYHYHGAAGCSETLEQSNGHAGMLGYALDGYGIFGMVDSQGNEDNDLDSCRGHYDETRGYHYHSASIAENMFIGCYSGEIAR
ncbi:hypothetical protein AMS58_10895 [Pseudoalteromonas porphyrae]|uniref:YHYH domain-containing protein n=2 Tax=Pseudoalteromonas TaxID=53246 RepID=A0A0N1MV78_9GAMM|nr:MULTISPECIES: YHYH protein [Pseudoalteromonas]KPH64650.1 hypothetical protein ADS77_05095 [Pseudoalteromonas porphyrae]KPH94511.1 hypothetical protein AMS58_10895 [Pseudoalteromonas porphyrae]NNG43961.1 YHYH protein [Pseudoalteromonas sp. NEC-BIFX-2020_002]